VVSLAFPRLRAFRLWTERWQSSDERLRALDETLRATGGVVRRGGSYDAWDLEVRGGMLGGGRMIMAVEEHGGGRQLVRLRAWPICSPGGVVVSLGFGVFSAGAAAYGAWPACVVLGATSMLCIVRTLHECASAMGTTLHALRAQGFSLR
jgi:hypothetical protein